MSVEQNEVLDRENTGQLWNTVLYKAALQPVSATSLTVNKIFFLINGAEILLKNRILLFYIYKLLPPIDAIPIKGEG